MERFSSKNTLQGSRRMSRDTQTHCGEGGITLLGLAQVLFGTQALLSPSISILELSHQWCFPFSLRIVLSSGHHSRAVGRDTKSSLCSNLCHPEKTGSGSDPKICHCWTWLLVQKEETISDQRAQLCEGFNTLLQWPPVEQSRHLGALHWGTDAFPKAHGPSHPAWLCQRLPHLSLLFSGKMWIPF